MIMFQKNFLFHVEQHKLVYCSIPKVGCTSIKSWIQDLLKLPSTVDTQTDVNISKLTLSRNSNQSVIDILESKENFVFCFVRNPWHRTISGFINKFGSYHQHLYRFLQNNPIGDYRRFHESYHEPFVAHVLDAILGETNQSTEGITFKQFVSYLASTADSELDPHWKPQSCFVQDIRLDFVGKLENFQNDFRRVAEKVQCNGTLSIRNASNKGAAIPGLFADIPCGELINAIPRLTHHNFYDDELINSIAKRYRTDIERFGYQYAFPFHGIGD